MTEAELYQFLKQHRLGVLGTVSAAGMPQSALVGIAITRDLEIIFDTVKSSRKYPNLILKPPCSFVIGCHGEKTVQYEGTARELESPELERYQSAYFEAFPDGPARLAWPGIVYFAVTPLWIRYSDFDSNSRLIQEFDFTRDQRT